MLRPPPHLKGKEIGLWYARQSKLKAKKIVSYAEPTEFTLDQRLVERIAGVVKDVERLGDCLISRKRTLPSKNSKTESSDLSFASIEEMMDERVFEAEDEKTPCSVELQRNETLDKSLQLEMIDKVQAPKYVLMNSKRINLPTFAQKQEFLKMLDENQVVVISGDTGCGKTTQLPQYLLEHAVLQGYGSCTRIVVTQPRRISAISVAERVATERGQRLGEDIGYQIRLESVLPKRPQGSILFCTTGIVLQWFQSDPLLKSVSHVIVDEVHEREMLGDFLITMLKRILPLRPDLRVILMSATLNSEEFAQFFDGCPRLEIPGRTFAVDAFYLEDVLHRTGFEMAQDALYRFSKTNQRVSQVRADSVGNPSITPAIRQGFKQWLKESIPRLSPGSRQFLEAMDLCACPPPELVAAVIDYIIRTTSSGAILAFVPGLSDILDTIKALRSLDSVLYAETRGGVMLHSLHSRLPSARQRVVFEPPPTGKRKVVIATNIAETSITIEDIVYVVDSGQIKITTYDPHTNTSTLARVLVSKANAAQRRGRAGRVRPGQCFHLFSSFTHDRVMLDFLPPEITRIRLEDVILRIKVLELGPVALKPRRLSCTDSVPTAQLSRMSKRQRNRLLEAAIEVATVGSPMTEDNDVLTPLGHHMANLPMDPQCAKLLILGAFFCCLKPTLAVSACLAFKEPFEVPLGFEALADARRAELTEGSQSDHWAFYVALSEYLNLREHEKCGYCRKNFLNRRTMDDLCHLMRDFADLLYERKYIKSRDMNEAEVNRHSHDVRIFRAILAGALYPNLIMATARRANPGRPLPAPFINTSSIGEKVTLHNKSVNALVRPQDRLWLTYFQKMKLDHDAASTIFDSTLINARPVVFFSSKISHSKADNDGTLVVDDWVRFKSGPRVPQLVESLKHCLERLLNEKVRYPGPTNWDSSNMEGRILQTIVDYFINEAPPAFELGTNHNSRHRGFAHQQGRCPGTANQSRRNAPYTLGFPQLASQPD
ncbi:ATP-dependent DNA/RNA helicase DHX36 [Taenia crassiceps]|uniref:ATP-dependent DNA/RNA helicase DHX36 n=1 Tax=Taenia crassiceps TaxID=6207 RepID=A0ABR4QI10_9CEST